MTKCIFLGGRGHASRRNGISSGIKQPIYNDVYEFNFENETWNKIPTVGDFPAPRKALCAIVYKNRMYIYGGWNNETYFNDMYYLQLDVSPMVWCKVNQQGQVPKARFDYSAILYKSKNVDVVRKWGFWYKWRWFDSLQ